MASDPNIYLNVGSDPTSNRKALETAISLANLGPGVRPLVIPHGFTVDRPVLAFGPNVELRGDRPGAILSCRWSAPPIVLGINPAPGCVDGTLPPGPRKWTGDHVKEGFGKVDGTLASKIGAWSGISTFGSDGLPDTIYAFPNSPFTNPRNSTWEAISAATWDLCYEADPATPLGLQLCGTSQGPHARPVTVRTANVGGNPTHEIHFEATDGVDRWFRVPISEMSGGQASGLRRLTFAIDLQNAKVYGWSGGNQVAIDGAGLGADFAPGNTLTFADAGLSAFKLAGLGLEISAWQDSFGGPAKYTFYGARILAGCPYIVGDPGSIQTVAASGKPATDAARYTLVGDPQQHIAALDLTQPPRDSRFVRWLASLPNSTAGFGMALLGASHTNPLNTGCSARLVDLNLQSIGPSTFGYGAGIWAGGTLNGGFAFERCSFLGGGGFGGLMAGAAYPVLFRDCTFQGFGGRGFTARMMTAHFEGTTSVLMPARDGMVFVASVVDISNLFMSECGPGCQTNITLKQGGRLTLRDFMFDTEYNAAPTLAVVLAERGIAGDSPGTCLELHSGVIDGGKAGTPLVLLRDMSDQAMFPGYVSLRGVSSWHADRGPTIATDGPAWQGEVAGFLGNKGAWRVHDPKWGAAGAITGVVEAN